jgi:ATP-dependent Clp protease ATP-binding subunit ClpC
VVGEYDKQENTLKVGKETMNYLETYAMNLTNKVAANIEDYNVIGREEEISKMIVSLSRKGKNSPLLIAQAGVGKTALVEGLTKHIIEGNIPPQFEGMEVYSLELSSLMGEDNGGFIVKFRGIIEECVARYGEILLFIDEIHTLVGSGGSGSFLDGGNIIKPVLARGEIQIIGATTVDEYHESIEQDRALERRFQVIHIDEPTPSQAIEILRGTKGRYEKFQGVSVPDEVIQSCVDLSVRYVTDFFLPDKAFDLLDETCAYVSANGRKEVEVVDVAHILKQRTGINVDSILKDDIHRMVGMSKAMKQRVKGQDSAIKEVVNAIAIAKIGLQDTTKPVATFLMLGTTGVGKTELAKTLTAVLFDDENNMIRCDMSEFSQEGSSERLRDYLCEKVRTKPYSVVLLDEVEKANRECHDLFLQILDDGRLSDEKGRVVNFRNTIVICTTNLGADLIKKQADVKGDTLEQERDERQFIARIDGELKNCFRPELVNRFGHKIVFRMLDEKVIQDISRKALEEINQLLRKKGYRLRYTASVIDYLKDNGTDKENGARPIARLIESKIKSPLSKILLKNELNGADKNTIYISVDGHAPREDELFDLRKLKIVSTKE